MSSKNLNDEFEKQILKDGDIEFQFVLMYDKYFTLPRDYGNGEVLTMVEIHTIVMINENPGITVNELSQKWGRTKGALSQTVSKLLDKGYITKKVSSEDRRYFNLFTTDHGKEMAKMHRRYDIRSMSRFREELLSCHSEEEIKTFYKVMETYISKFSK